MRQTGSNVFRSYCFREDALYSFLYFSYDSTIRDEAVEKCLDNVVTVDVMLNRVYQEGYSLGSLPQNPQVFPNRMKLSGFVDYSDL